MDTATETTPKPKSGWLNLAIDYGPVVVFFLVYRLTRPADQGSSTIGEVLAVTQSTIAFIIATVIALAVSKWKLGRISPMLWLSTVLVIGFGAITVWTGDQRVIQAKPTVIYLVFGVLLIGGWLRGSALLKVLLEAAFDGLDEQGWLKLSRNWGGFFLFLAGLNEALVWQLSFGDWLAAKLVVFLPLSFLFTFTQIPMLLRHGLAREEEAKAVAETPHE